MAMRAGDVRIEWKGGKTDDKLKSMLTPRLRRCGSQLRNHVMRKITEGKTRMHGPSEPGTPPHVDTGHLRKNIFWELLPSGWSVRVFTTVDYGRHLEEGTRKMAARPYLRPSLNELEPTLRQILAGKYNK